MQVVGTTPICFFPLFHDLNNMNQRGLMQAVRHSDASRPDEFGDACAYLGSTQAGFISGQNLQRDGVSYSGPI